MTKGEFLNCSGEFIRNIGRDEYYVTLSFGCFIWSKDMNHIYTTTLSYDEWAGDYMGTFVGIHTIRTYCGPNVQITLE